jgi:hypothetical protein
VLSEVMPAQKVYPVNADFSGLRASSQVHAHALLSCARLRQETSILGNVRSDVVIRSRRKSVRVLRGETNKQGENKSCRMLANAPLFTERTQPPVNQTRLGGQTPSILKFFISTTQSRTRSGLTLTTAKWSSRLTLQGSKKTSLI